MSEEVPGARWLAGITPMFPDAREIRGEEQQVPLRVSGHPVTTAICFEPLFPDLVRRSVVSDRAEAGVALANDACFGDSWAPWMLLASAQPRAVENGRYVVRAVGSGVSAIVDPFGRVTDRRAPMSRAELPAPIGFRSATTPYQTYGEAPWVIAVALGPGGAAFPPARAGSRAARALLGPPCVARPRVPELPSGAILEPLSK